MILSFKFSDKNHAVLIICNRMTTHAQEVLQCTIKLLVITGACALNRAGGVFPCVRIRFTLNSVLRFVGCSLRQRITKREKAVPGVVCAHFSTSKRHEFSANAGPASEAERPPVQVPRYLLVGGDHAALLAVAGH